MTTIVKSIVANKEIVSWCKLAGFTSLAELLKEKELAGQIQTITEYEIWLIDEFRKKIGMSTLSEFVNSKESIT